MYIYSYSGAASFSCVARFLSDGALQSARHHTTASLCSDTCQVVIGVYHDMISLYHYIHKKQYISNKYTSRAHCCVESIKELALSVDLYHSQSRLHEIRAL
jgi:hypothetical protein